MISHRDRIPGCLANPSGREALKVVGARDCTLFGASGREYLDLTSGWNVANLGWANDAISRRVKAQLDSLALAPNWCLHEPGIQLATDLCACFDQSMAMLRACTGTQAIEFALRIARRATGRYAIVSVAECYHGSTLGSLAASGIEYLKKEDQPLEAWHRDLPIDAPVSVIRQKILTPPLPAAVLVEPLFTNPGAIDAGREYYEAIVGAAGECGSLIIVDEIGTGLGRLGHMFGFERFGMRPDIVTLGKSLGGGIMPISAVLMQERLVDAARGLAFDSTFAGTPAACAAASATVDILKHSDLLQRARVLGDRFLERVRRNLATCTGVREVRGTGLLFGIETEKSGRAEQARFARAIEANLLDAGVFAASSRYTNSLLIMPPLTISEAKLMWCADLLPEIFYNSDRVHG